MSEAAQRESTGPETTEVSKQTAALWEKNITRALRSAKNRMLLTGLQALITGWLLFKVDDRWGYFWPRLFTMGEGGPPDNHQTSWTAAIHVMLALSCGAGSERNKPEQLQGISFQTSVCLPSARQQRISVNSAEHCFVLSCTKKEKGENVEQPFKSNQHL